ncbi:tyrosine-type recombinase/integrase [Nonomuraea sp. CA-141351]|uniref:tyrosine-type recombinase/integrase n=1 Tax=Nonomuraea sp. CA-141351 TaxID=3239996 RepID=UPI003D8A6812
MDHARSRQRAQPHARRASGAAEDPARRRLAAGAGSPSGVDPPAPWRCSGLRTLEAAPDLGPVGTAYRDELGMDADLVPHCLRHAYVTHLVEDGVDPKFVQDQVGHRFASTTAIYTGVSTDFMNTMMRKALDQAFDHEERERR